MCRHRELEPAITAGALIETRSGAPLAAIAAGDRNRASVSAGGTFSVLRGKPEESHEKPWITMILLSLVAPSP